MSVEGSEADNGKRGNAAEGRNAWGSNPQRRTLKAVRERAVLRSTPSYMLQCYKHRDSEFTVSTFWSAELIHTSVMPKVSNSGTS